jgi:cytoskeletal protein CcmA (bactofilin family)
MGSNNVSIAGNGTVASGSYGNVTINGAGTVHGDMTCDTLKINGAGTCEGAVTANVITVNGTGTFRRQVHAGQMNVNGEASIAGGAGVGTLKVKGRLGVSGGVAANLVELKGYMDIGEGCEADTFTSDGVFNIGGLLNAGVVDIRLYGTCKVREIGGESIIVREYRSLWALLGSRRLYADVIEGDKINLENTTAKVVRGVDIDLGPGCEIEVVEYAGELRQGAGAKVGSAVKTTARV